MKQYNSDLRREREKGCVRFLFCLILDNIPPEIMHSDKMICLDSIIQLIESSHDKEIRFLSSLVHLNHYYTLVYSFTSQLCTSCYKVMSSHAMLNEIV